MNEKTNVRKDRDMICDLCRWAKSQSEIKIQQLGWFLCPGYEWCDIVNLFKHVRTVMTSPALPGRFGMGVLMNVPSTNVWRMEASFLSSLTVRKSPHQFVNERLSSSWASLTRSPAAQRRFVVCTQLKLYSQFMSWNIYVYNRCEKVGVHGAGYKKKK